MKASDIMISRVITVGLHAPVSENAVLLAKRRISAVSVVEDGRLVGRGVEEHRCMTYDDAPMT